MMARRWGHGACQDAISTTTPDERPRLADARAAGRRGVAPRPAPGGRGRALRKDSRLEKWTYPGFLGIEGSRRRAAARRRGGRDAAAPGARHTASACGHWHWTFSKGSADEQPQHDVAHDRLARRPPAALRRATRMPR